MRGVAAAKLPRARAASGSLTLTLSRFGGRGNYANLPAVAAITLFAFAVRVLRLAFVNFHSDEAFFIQIAYQGTFMRSMSIDEPHPPLFLALLQAWMGPAGVTEYAIRLLPVLAGTLLVPLTYQLGRLLGSRRLGLAAAFAAAANPLFIFYAREVRDNGLMAFSGALSFVLLLLALRRPALLPAYIVAAMAALFSHYYNVAIVALQLAIGAAWLARRHKLRLWPWAAAPAVLLAGYAPWLAFARSSIANYDVGRGTPAVFLAGLTQTFQAFTVGFSIQTWIVLWACLAMGGLLLIGLAGLAFIGPEAFAIALAYVLTPVLFGVLTLLHQTNFNPRYLFAGAPGYPLLAGAGLALLWRWHWVLGGLVGLFLLGLTGIAVRNVGFTSEFQPNGYREMTAYLARHAAPGEVMALDGVSQWPLYWYYAQLRSGLPQRVEFLPRESPADTQQSVRDVLTEGGAWYVESDVDRYDPGHDVERLLTSDGYQALDRHFGGQRLEYFAGEEALSGRSADVALEGMRLTMIGSQVRASAGRPLRVELSWRHEAGPVKPFKLSLRLQDAGGALIAQNDSLPLGGYANFGAWGPGQLLRERAGLIVPIGTLPGSYSLRALVYDAASGQALGPAIGLGSISVDHAASQDPAAAELPAVGLAVGSARLEAAQLPKNGVIPGDPVPITLLWSGGPIAEPIRFSLAVAGQRLDRVAGGDSYPTTRWQARDVVRDIVSVRIPPSISAGTYPVTIDGTRIGTLRVLPAGRSFTPPPLAHEVHARFGDLVELLGFDSQPRAGGLQVQLVWQALNETEVSYTVFVHALAQDGRVASQVDQPPGTDRWVKGQVVTTSSDLLLPGPAADYRLEVGVYDAATGKRLPVAGGDSVILAP